MAGDLKFEAELVDKITPELRNIQGEINKVNTAFGLLKTRLASIGFGALITGAVQYAAAIDDVASSTGIATENVIGFAKAFTQFGGSTEGALTGLARFQNLIDDAVKGNKQAQENFSKLGITLSDLGKLSEQDLLRKTIKGLSELPKGAERTAAAMTLLGKSAATVNFDDVNDNLDRLISKSQSSARAVEAAAAAEEKFGVAIDTFKVKLLETLEPISRFFAAIDPKAIESFVEKLVELGKIIAIIGGAFAVFKYAVTPLRNFGSELVALSVQGYTTKEALGSIFGPFLDKLKSATGGQLKGFKNEISLLGGAFKNTAESGMKGATGLERFGVALSALSLLISRVLGWITLLYAAFEVLNSVLKMFGVDLVDALDKAGAKMANILGIAYKTEEQKKKELDDQNKLNKAKEDEAKQAERKREVLAYFQEQLDKEKQKLDQVVISYKDQQQEQLKKFALQTKSLTLTEEQALAEQTRAEAEDARLKAIKPLQDQINSIKEKGAKATEMETALLPELAKKIGEINASYKSNEPLREKELADRLRILNITKEQAFQQDLLNKVASARQTRQSSQEDFDRQTKLLGLSEDQRLEVERLDTVQKNYLSGIQPLLDQHAQLTQKINNLKELGNQDLAKEEEQLAKIRIQLQGLTADYQNSLQGEQASIQERRKSLDDTQLRLFGTKSLIDLTQKLQTLEDQRAGLNLGSLEKQYQAIDIAARDSAESELQAYAARRNILRDQVPASVVEEYYKKATEGSERLKISTRSLYNESRDFGTGWTQAFNSYVENSQNAATQAKTYFDIMSKGIEDSIVRFVQTGKLSFKDLANSLIAEFVRMEAKAAVAKLFPKEAGGGGGGLFDIVKGIGSAIFGGFRASGGPVMANRPYVVGERGPEMFVPNTNGSIVPNNQLTQQQPAMVTNVNYNIQAVDAMSFKQMVARDPEFIYNVTEQARRNLPQRSRR